MGKIKFSIAEWKEKLKNCADINTPDKKGWTALDYAIRADSIEGVEFCINKGADVNRKIEKHDYATPLHFAAKYSKKPEMIEILVKHGAKIDALDMCEYSQLNYAAFHNTNPDIIKKLVELGSDINEYNVFLSAFQSACLSNPSLEVIKTIIRLGADFDVQDALCFAAVNKNLYILKYMLKLGGDINTKSKTLGKDFPLHNAVYNKNPEVLKFLLEKGAYKTINAKDEFGNTPLISAVFPGNLENIKILLEAGADVNAKNNQGETPLSCAVKYKAKDKIFEKLLASGANVETEDYMVKSAVATFLERQKIKSSATQLRLFEDKKG